MYTGKAAEKVRAAHLSVASNTCLTAFKFIVGFLTGSISIIAEGLHSLNDLVASAIATMAVRQSGKPPDREHRYGHGKAEALSALVEALLIVFAAVFIIHEAVDRLLHPQAVELLELGIAVMLVSMIVNIVVSLRLYSVARKTDSAALEADAAHLSTDVVTSAGVFLGLIALRLTNYQPLDPLIAALVALMIIYTGGKLVLKSSRELMDTRLAPEEELKVRRVLDLHRADFQGVHRLRTRKSGSERHIDLHLVLPKRMSVEKGHALADHLEREMMKEMPGAHLMIHVEPCSCECSACQMTGNCGYREVPAR